MASGNRSERRLASSVFLPLLRRERREATVAGLRPAFQIDSSTTSPASSKTRARRQSQLRRIDGPTGSPSKGEAPSLINLYYRSKIGSEMAIWLIIGIFDKALKRVA